MSLTEKCGSIRAGVFAVAIVGLVTAGLWFGAQFNSTQANTNNLTLAAAPAATLTVEGNMTPTTQQHVVDFDGNGKTDFALVRNIGGGPSGQIRWFIGFNGAAGGFNPDWGIATDFLVPEDYDGDNKSDIAIWRPGAAGTAAFYILQSATNTVRIDTFGQNGDDPTVVGDYDGDGKADVAVYRSGASAGDQSTWYYRGSLTPVTVNFIPWGQNGDFPAPGDYDGDGKNDFVIQRASGGSGVFWMNTTTAGISTITFGNSSDAVVPGDYDGDSKTDIAVVRNTGGAFDWYFRSSLTGAVSQASWGNSLTDLTTQGDYDGDGKTDFAIWRPSSMPGMSAFWYLGSTSGAGVVAYGTDQDYPVANYNTH